MGATAVVRTQAEETALSFTHGQGLDHVLICADTPTSDPVELAGEIARDRGHVVAIGAVGLNIPRRIYYQKELSFINSRSYGPGRYDPAYEEGGQDYPIGYVRWSEGNLQARQLAERPDETTITHHFQSKMQLAYELITGKSVQPPGRLATYPRAAQQDKTACSEWAGDQDSLPIAGVNVVRIGVLGAGNFATAVMLPR
jgi:hypothetical protein